MDLSKLGTLQQKLVEAGDFAPVWDYFMTNFGEQDWFMDLGERTRSPMLEAAISQAAEEILGGPVPLERLLLVRLPEQRFIHGALQLQGKFANVFYFEEVGVGLLTVVLSFAGDTRLARFTAHTNPGTDLARQ